MRRRTASALVGVAVLGVVVATGYAVLHHVTPLFTPDGCTATVDGHSVSLSPEQGENAALIVAVSVQRGMPARAASIALAKGDGYDTMQITAAAQEFQHSGYPEAYADHETDARTLASALTGNSPHAFTCVVRGDVPKGRAKLNDLGLTHRADSVRREVETVFGHQSLGGFAAGGVSSGHMKGSAHYDGRAIDIFERPITPANKIKGWAIAQYLVAQADRLSIQTVIFDDRIWQSGSSSSDGWTNYDPPETSGDRAILEHRDHVHVDVFP